jgi:hypothetical protein
MNEVSALSGLIATLSPLPTVALILVAGNIFSAMSTFRVLPPRVRRCMRQPRALKGVKTRIPRRTGVLTPFTLREELTAYPGVTPNPERQSTGRVMLLHELRLDNAALALFSTTTTFGTACDVTLAELTIEAFYPADTQTATALAEAASAG